MASVPPIQAFTLGADAAYLSLRDPPTAPDDRYDWQVSEDDVATKSGHSTITNLITQIEILKGKGVYVPPPKTVVCVSFPTIYRWLIWCRPTGCVRRARRTPDGRR
jgi:hypothetical protein